MLKNYHDHKVDNLMNGNLENLVIDTSKKQIDKTEKKDRKAEYKGRKLVVTCSSS